MFPYTIQVLVVRYKSMANVNHIHDANNVTQKIFDHEPRKIQFEKQILFINKQTVQASSSDPVTPFHKTITIVNINVSQSSSKRPPSSECVDVGIKNDVSSVLVTPK